MVNQGVESMKGKTLLYLHLQSLHLHFSAISLESNECEIISNDRHKIAVTWIWFLQFNVNLIHGIPVIHTPFQNPTQIFKPNNNWYISKMTSLKYFLHNNYILYVQSWLTLHIESIFLVFFVNWWSYQKKKKQHWKKKMWMQICQQKIQLAIDS